MNFKNLTNIIIIFYIFQNIPPKQLSHQNQECPINYDNSIFFSSLEHPEHMFYKKNVILTHQKSTLLFYRIILQYFIYKMFYYSILYIKIIFTTY